MSGSEVYETPPAIGRIVHYVSYGTPGREFVSECRAAIVAGIPFAGNPGDDLVDLVVFNPQGLYFNRVPYSAEPKGGTFHSLEDHELIAVDAAIQAAVDAGLVEVVREGEDGS